MPSVNKVTLLGNAGRDAELRTFPDGGQICNVAIATSRSWKDKTSGEKHEETEWHRLVFRDRLAEIAGEYITKGKPIYVEGRLKTRKYTDKDGVERFATEILCDELQLLGSRDDAAPPSRPAAPAPAARPAPKAAPTGTGFDDMEDDLIPF